MIGWVDDRPIPRDRLDRRVTDLRTGPLSAALPVPGSSEDRQLARWLTQVILTEALCEATAESLGLAPSEGPPLDRLAAIELGSINAAAYNGSPWVRAMFEHVTAEVEIPPQWRPRPPSNRSPGHSSDRSPGHPFGRSPGRPSDQFSEHASDRSPGHPSDDFSEHPSERSRRHPSDRPPGHIVRYRLFSDRASAERATSDDLEPLGTVDLDSLPTAISEELRRRPPGTLAGPIADALGWHIAIALPTTDPTSTDPTSTNSTPTDPTYSDPTPTNPTATDPIPTDPTSPKPAATPNSALPDHDRSQLREAARRRAFARWLDEARAERITLVPGLEHPGDPRQPDNHHKH